MNLFYQPNIETELTLEKEEHTHATRVLRKKTGDCVYVMDGKGSLFTCKLIDIGSKKSSLSILDKKKYEQTNSLHLAIAPTKNNSRLEFFLEKATEIGIAEITPILCMRSERKVIKPERFIKLLIAAAKQSKCYHLPILNSLTSFKNIIQDHSASQKFIAHCEKDQTKRTLAAYNPKKEEPVLILIGPEGDFTKEEIALAQQGGVKNLSLGETRLRTETAGIVACVHYQML